MTFEVATHVAVETFPTYR